MSSLGGKVRTGVVIGAEVKVVLSAALRLEPKWSSMLSSKPARSKCGTKGPHGFHLGRGCLPLLGLRDLLPKNENVNGTSHTTVSACTPAAFLEMRRCHSRRPPDPEWRTLACQITDTRQQVQKSPNISVDCCRD